jgi:tripartite-type tricarboxylate transporter receptor subunit TctC
MQRRHWLTSTFAALAWPRIGTAQGTYPDRPIQVLVGFPGGGALDVATRIALNAMEDAGIRSVVVINKPGASATIAAAQVARAPGDGYSALLATSSNLGIAPYLYPKLAFAPDKDFEHVAQFGVSQNVIYCNASSGIRTFSDFLKAIRARPGGFNYASPGSGTTAHLCFEMLKAGQKLFVVHVPFRGSPPAVTAVLGGELDIGIDALGPPLPYIQAGKLIALATTGQRRSAALPQVPTLAELGVQGIPAGTFLGFSLPADTPQAIRLQWSQATAKAVASASVVTEFQKIGIDPTFLDGPAFTAAILSERHFWKEAVAYSGATGT